MATAKAPKITMFTYQGKDRAGKVRKGEVSGSNPALVKAELRRQGIMNVKLTKKRAEFSLFGSKIKTDDIAIFTRQMATMMKAGVPLMRAFEIVAEGLQNPKMAELVMQMKNTVSSGGTFGSALREHPKYFDDLYCSLVESGEQAGALETMLDRVALYKEKSESLKRKIKSALKYPITVLVIAAIITALLLIKVVPVFSDMFSSFGADLPAPTQIVVNMSDWMLENGLLFFIALIGVGFGIQQSLQRSEKVRHAWQRTTLRLPIFGKMFYQAAMARYARTLSTTFAAGVPLVEALDSAAGASGNIVYETAIRNVRKEVESGTELAVAMRGQNTFPPMLLQMVAIGEQSGALDDMLAKAAVVYEEEVDTMVEGLTSMMEPLIMSVLGIIVGGLVVSMYLPIFQMGTAI